MEDAATNLVVPQSGDGGPVRVLAPDAGSSDAATVAQLTESIPPPKDPTEASQDLQQAWRAKDTVAGVAALLCLIVALLRSKFLHERLPAWSTRYVAGVVTAAATASTGLYAGVGWQEVALTSFGVGICTVLGWKATIFSYSKVKALKKGTPPPPK